MINKKFEKESLKLLSRLAVKSTEKLSNTACVLIQYQPKESEKIKKMRKF